jgi:hypothetical protein
MKKTLFALIIVNLLFSQLLAVFTYAGSQECESISVVFLRGSGQNINYENIDDTGTLESEQQTKAFFTQLDKRMINVSKEFISFHNSYQWR